MDPQTLSTGASIASSIINNAWNSANASQANKRARENYKMQFNDAVDFYKKYSSPLALRQQYEQAGFSPYASLGASGASAPSPGIADPVTPNIDAGLGDAVNKGLQAKWVDIQTQTAQENLNYIKEQTIGQKIANANADLFRRYNENYLEVDNALKRFGSFFNNWDRDKFNSILREFDNTLINDNGKLNFAYSDSLASFFDNDTSNYRSLRNSLTQSQTDLNNTNNQLLGFDVEANDSIGYRFKSLLPWLNLFAKFIGSKRH